MALEEALTGQLLLVIWLREHGAEAPAGSTDLRIIPDSLALVVVRRIQAQRGASHSQHIGIGSGPGDVGRAPVRIGTAGPIEIGSATVTRSGQHRDMLRSCLPEE